jgi:diazepam-binding inhibitor (GABA receptor modulating acyl-CoA-binding protein)
MSEPAAQTPFDTAVVDSKKLTSKPNNDELLELYALYKVATGEKIADAPEPGMFDLKGKAKKKAWQKVVDEGITEEEAKSRYVTLVEKLKETYGYDADKEPEAVGA